MANAPIRVLCVEDNQLVAEAIGRKLSGDSDFTWLGWVDSMKSLLEKVDQAPPDIVCMDLDMPGQDAFAMIRLLKDRCPHARVLILSGHVHADYIDQAVEAGAWGYLSKAEESRVIVDAFRRVAAGSFVLGRLSQSEWKQPAIPSISRPVPPTQAEPKPSFWTRLKIFRGQA